VEAFEERLAHKYDVAPSPLLVMSRSSPLFFQAHEFLSYTIPIRTTPPLLFHLPRLTAVSQMKSNPLLGDATIPSPVKLSFLSPRCASIVSSSGQTTLHIRLSTFPPILSLPGSLLANAALTRKTSSPISLIEVIPCKLFFQSRMPCLCLAASASSGKIRSRP